MTVTFGEAVEQVQLAEGVLDDEAKKLLNSEHKLLVVRAHTRKRRVALSTNDSAFRIWDLPADFRMLEKLNATLSDDSVREYSEHVSEATMDGIRSGRITAYYADNGLYANYVGADSTKRIEIWPALESGDVLSAVVATAPPTLANDSDEFSCPDESIEVIVDCALTRIRRRHDDDYQARQVVLPEMEAEIARLLEMEMSEMGDDSGTIPIIGVDA